jgi:hypothetical protein
LAKDTMVSKLSTFDIVLHLLLMIELRERYQFYLAIFEPFFV